ncbi:type II toxin-antitoxin system VapB family antitoxin [Microbacterium sp. C7(2022)]|uniref:type II toxin-antitoxin system VapB family antitoxin n=1 Tax=Microbacterium sp. C7(2022) TaxID=2992759 RepID=UPI00237C4F97|nr:type II toxin-antitoxin system VapB family antitoxin [Microbacterium sp. C7(2022)]MDE0545197.1 type II toxin-antitoxin system VapB family antitoxin [Microbacterium sp. C7(2022)]
MSLNIKNEDVHALVRELATALGVSQTSAVELAVRDKLATVRSGAEHHARQRRIERAVADAQEAFRGIDLRAFADNMYDPQTGLPR